MDKKAKECIRMLRDLVSDVQGAPFPGGDINTELYAIWYEHAQKAAVECFEFLNARTFAAARPRFAFWTTPALNAPTLNARPFVATLPTAF